MGDCAGGIHGDGCGGYGGGLAGGEKEAGGGIWRWVRGGYRDFPFEYVNVSRAGAGDGDAEFGAEVGDDSGGGANDEAAAGDARFDVATGEEQLRSGIELELGGGGDGNASTTGELELDVLVLKLKELAGGKFLSGLKDGAGAGDGGDAGGVKIGKAGLARIACAGTLLGIAPRPGLGEGQGKEEDCRQRQAYSPDEVNRPAEI